jgi:hypothetical protein
MSRAVDLLVEAPVGFADAVVTRPRGDFGGELA